MSEAPPALLARPVFIVSPPRAGSSLLFRTLMQAPGAYTIGGESHHLVEGIDALHPRMRGWSSNRLTAEDATPALIEELAARFHAALRDRDGRPPAGAARMIEKTPKNSLRVPFLDAAFPDALFVYLHRDARETLSSMLEAWASGKFRTYPSLPDWPGGSWSLLLTPGWRDWRDLPLPEIVARQWATTTRILIDDLAKLPADRVKAVSYADFLASPQATVASLCGSLDIGWDRKLTAPLPLSPSVVSPPRPGKWRHNQQFIDRIWPLVEQEEREARAFAGGQQSAAGG
jgi:hypothetical protein